MSEQRVGDLLGDLKIDLADEELVAGAIILLKTIDEKGWVGIKTVWTDGMSWVERIGMHHVAIETEDEDTRRNMP